MSLSGAEAGKSAAAKAAVDEHVTADMKYLGIGSGSTVVYAVKFIADFAKAHQIVFQCVPTSYQSKQLITANAPHLQLVDLSQAPLLDLDIDGADEVDSQLNCIKGGGGCQTQEKVVAFASKKFVVIADARKDSEKLGTQWHTGIPIEVVPMAIAPVMQKLQSLRPNSQVKLRMAVSKAGPVVTDNGMFVVDWHIGQFEASEVQSIDQTINMVPGVVETGLFVNMADVAYFGQDDGSVKKRNRS